jgi:hypothetical protein
MTPQEFQRFEAKIVYEPMTGCWLWSGARGSQWGHGQFRLTGKARSAHRVSYEHFKGLIPPGLVLDHLCEQPCCVNPEHLKACTQKENVLRGVGPTAKNAIKSFCKRGHLFDQKNTYRYWKGRMCRVCARDKMRERRQG